MAPIGRTRDLQTRRALLSAGATDREIAGLVRSGELVRVDHGVFAAAVPSGATRLTRSTGPTRPTPSALRSDPTAAGGVESTPMAAGRRVDYERLVRATVLRSRDPIVSHLSAIALLGLPMIVIPDRVHVTVPSGSGGQRRGVVHRHPCPDPPPVIRRQGVRMTDPARTLVDVARTEPLSTGVVALDAALHAGLVDEDSLQAELDQCGRRRGSARARRAVALADGRSESPGESLTRLLLADLGFPPPALQVEARDADGRFLGRADFGYLTLGVLIEFDGLGKYGGSAAGSGAVDVVIAEKLREDGFRAAGFIVVRLIWRNLWEPDLVRRLVEQARAQGRRSTAAGLVTGTLRLARR